MSRAPVPLGRRSCRPDAERLGGVGDRPNLTEWDELWAVGWGLFWVKLLRLVEPRGPKPPAAEARNS